MRMSSLAKKGDKGKSSNPSFPQSKDTHQTSKVVSKIGDAKNTELGKADQMNPKVQPTAEQLRIAQMISDSKRDDPELPDKVNKLVELTNCSADAAIIALHDSNNDLDHAIAALLDGETEGDVWEVSGKKKKPKAPVQQPSKDVNEVMETGNGTGPGRGRDRDRDRSRNSRAGPPRLRGRGRGRGRDNKENVEDEGEVENLGAGTRGRGSRSGPRMSNGPGREGSGARGGGASGRGGRGNRRGTRPPAGTDNNWEEGAEYSTMTNVEPWGVDFPSAEDWDNEEYIGSLVETKVFTPSQSTAATVPIANVPEAAPLTNGSASLAAVVANSIEQPIVAPQVHYSTINNSAQQGIDLNALLQKTSGVTVAGSAMQQQFLQYSQQSATDALKAAMGVGGSSKSVKPTRSKIPPSSKIPLSAVEMPDDSLVSGLDVKFGTLDFGIEPSGFEIGLEMSRTPASTVTNNSLAKQEHHHHQQQQHGLMSKMDHQYGSAPTVQPPAASSLPKPDSSLGGFSTTASSAGQSMSTSSAQVKPTNTPASYPYSGTTYAPPGVNIAASQASAGGASQPAGAYPSSSQTSAAGVYSNSGSNNSNSYQGAGGQSGYGSYGQQQQQQQQSSSYQSYNNKMNSTSGLTETANSVSSLRVDLPSASSAGSNPSSRQQQQQSSTTAASATSTTSNKPTGTTMAASSSGLPNMPPGVPAMLGPGGFIMGQAPGLPYYATTAAGIQQHPVYSLEDMQYRYQHLAAGYYDMGYQSPTSLGTGREGTLASLAYASSDAKFSRNENNSPVPTSLSQNAAQSHGGAFIQPAAAAATPLAPAYAYYYSGGVMPGGYQFGAPALYPVSASASGHAGSGATAQYGKPLGGTATAAAQSGQATGGASSAGPSNATASGYPSYGSTYDEFSKSVYGSVGVGSAAGPTAKIGGVGASTGPSGVGASGSADLGVGPNVYGKTHNQLNKINTYDKTGGFHTGTPPPYNLAGNATGAPLGVGVNVGVGGPSPYGAQHMFIPTLAPHQSQHSQHLMHQQLHQDSNSGPGQQRSQTGGQQNKQGSKPTYGGSYWGSS